MRKAVITAAERDVSGPSVLHTLPPPTHPAAYAAEGRVVRGKHVSLQDAGDIPLLGTRCSNESTKL